ncbi:MAG: excinuclease ABC subunit A [Tenericutes bacterium GWC2_34_14]|nr:MAG: excinuclease ABC subunit A [Tenericutes bacterium GWC2_34_14]OHE32910.1 MAG: excinuclease ABC subunit A [Tenericutes bacterium GWE2_34_108]OHE36125.1 MAG: excinuclease ABC subunit A [Tenericutes bacterium GWF1_35_14]OHE39348.1 MAG: excinuclease ABC subunit A [Tenericutes bacterium GWF2_35_184]OHE43830.1 MAG: excinuclease ABC subunit A [Tenericutes bacterium RIFOXYA12_FULL_35_10]OHE44621.1 MAG: excinuclease ABC subunit A [Tenericutes bacterium RIFOXYA2_FULL_36_32]OHE48025.1 MAG: excinu
MDYIKVHGARENNLQNIDIEIPKNKLVVMTGISGSGKSSLAFDTLYQEGQRRYMESLSAYARQFLGNFEKPDVDNIEGLSPSISIDQKTTSNNPRSTVGTVTEIYDYLRLLYARVGTPYCPGTDEPLTKQSIEEMTLRVLSLKEGSRVVVMAPVVERQKGTHKKLAEQYLKEGFTRAYVDGQQITLEEMPELDKNKNHDFYLVIDRLIVKDGIRSRLYDALELAAKLASGKTKVLVGSDAILSFSQNYACSDSNFTIPELEPRLFSFNTPIGACPYCNGLGLKLEVTEELVCDPTKSLLDGGIIPYKNNDTDNLNNAMIEELCKHYDISISEPIANLPKEKLNYILYGSPDQLHFKMRSSSGRVHEKVDYFEGIINNLSRRYRETTSEWIRTWIEGFMTESECPVCHGARLNEQALSVKIGGKNMDQLTRLSIDDTITFLKHLVLNNEQQQIARLALQEIISRLTFLQDVGLGYLTLARSAGSLSGGEAQRIRLATQIGSKLTGVLYVLDEPSIGLHQRDNHKLIETLKKMRDLGNTLVVVEHDHETMLESDYLIDIGPRAGKHGGLVVAAGTPQEVMDNPNSITGRYLKGIEKVEIPSKRREGTGKDILVMGARENNLKDISVSFPLGKLTVVTGVSGSGKSTLVNEILMKGLQQKHYKTKEKPGLHTAINDHNLIDRVIEISQSPIGRTPRSNPATYTGVFDDVRDLYTQTNESKARGYEKGRFSFNVKGGRCEACSGDGVKKISMHFLPDVYVPCEVCGGTRYNHETLQIKYKGKNIADVLDMTVEEAMFFFENHPKIYHKMKTLYDVGLDYITLGQAATTLSGGEAQRVKLASELYRRITPSSIYILDEPTTGLHTDDVKRLLKVLHRIVDEGATMVIIEHNLDVIKNADYIIDLGPEGGDAGGEVVATGTPEEIAQVEASYTGQYLKKALEV